MIRPSSDRSPEPEPRLPPRVLGQRKKKPRNTKQLPWYRHTAWFIPLAACVMFAVLIVGGLAVRQVIILIHGAAPAEVGDGVTGSNGDVAVAGAGGGSAKNDEPPVSLASSEPGYEVLPPAAAKEPGRKLRKMLLVGPHRDMFPTLESAVEVAIPGDFIEIRTNGPLEVRSITREFEIKSPQPLTIRAGRGFQPVLRPVVGYLVNVKNMALVVRGLHFARSIQGGGVFSSQFGDVTCEDCSFTSVSALSLSNDAGEGKPARASFRRCLFRATCTIAVFGPNVTVELVDSAFVGARGSGAVAVNKLADNMTVEMRNCTFAQSHLFGTVIVGNWPAIPITFKMHRCIFSVISCCPTLVAINIPASNFSDNVPAAHDAFTKTFREFDVADNLVWYWDSWFASVNGSLLMATASPTDPTRRVAPPGIPFEFPRAQFVDFGPRYTQAQGFMFSGDSQKVALAPEILRSFLPEDLVPKPEGLWAEQMAAGIRYGCDPAKLPVPPPATLQ